MVAVGTVAFELLSLDADREEEGEEEEGDMIMMRCLSFGNGEDGVGLLERYVARILLEWRFLGDNLQSDPFFGNDL